MSTETDEKPKVSAVIPAYYEEKTIGEVVQMCLHHVDEVLVVDDGSGDDTAVNAEAAGARVIRLPRNMGVLKAVEAGLHEAKGNIIVTLDADGQHNPKDIPKLIQPIIDGEADLVMGVRPSFPHISERAITWVTNLRVKVGDTSTGFRAIRRETAAKLRLHGSCLCGTFVLEAARNGARVKGIPVNVAERKHGRRRIQTRHIRQLLYVAWDVIRF
ncbi:MAG TPA: glycosyltransferase family 2 protein [Candidatus Bathyarchaeia archaeon]